MTPLARLQEAIEALHLILTNAQPADQILHSFFRKRRFIGSKDRRYLSDLVYATLRHYFTLMQGLQLMDPNARLLVFGQCLIAHEYTLVDLKQRLGQDKYGPEILSVAEEKILARLDGTVVQLQPQNRVPTWLYPYLYDSFPQTLTAELDALDQVAPTDLRVNLLKGDRLQVLNDFAKEKISSKPTPWSPIGIRLAKRQPLQTHQLWENGVVEIQDEGSQLVALLVDAQPGMHVFDFCAGAGGKTLALAAMMANKGKIVATDVVNWRLDRSQERLRRCGVFNVECRLLDEENRKWLKRQENRYDRVLVDAPCSGTGTWRRNPDLKIRLREQDFKEITEKQQQILKQSAKLVKPNGRLIYATCSILRAENHDQINRFLISHPEFELQSIPEIWTSVIDKPCPTTADMLQLTPAQHQVDGFFVAVMRRAG